jgi:hypothetical protein
MHSTLLAAWIESNILLDLIKVPGDILRRIRAFTPMLLEMST